MDNTWNLNRLQKKINQYGSTNEGISIEYLLRVPGKDPYYYTPNFPELNEFLAWADDASSHPDLHIKRTQLPARFDWEHYGYVKGEGFKKIILIGSKSEK